MTIQIDKVFLEKVLHELVCVSGLYATDRPDLALKGVSEDLYFQINHDDMIDKITALLG